MHGAHDFNHGQKGSEFLKLEVLKRSSMKYLFLFLLLSGCANVKQIDRGRITSRIMQLNPTPEESVFLEEVNSYREGAAGGSASVGGGCGCN